MFNWLRELYELRAEFKERKLALTQRPCESCETLKAELIRANKDRDKLLDQILKKPEETERLVAPEPQKIESKQLSWRIKQQALEAEDRQKALTLKKFEEVNAKAKLDLSKLNTTELEKSIGVESDAPTGS